MNRLIMKVGLTAMMLLIGSLVLAETDHSTMDHSAMGHNMSAMPPVKEIEGMQMLSSVPASGKVREAGFDGKYVMEPIDAADTLQVRCAKASRGLMMMDNATWERCGGKSEGIPKTANAVKSAQPEDAMKGHAGHNM